MILVSNADDTAVTSRNDRYRSRTIAVSKYLESCYLHVRTKRCAYKVVQFPVHTLFCEYIVFALTLRRGQLRITCRMVTFGCSP